MTHRSRLYRTLLTLALLLVSALSAARSAYAYDQELKVLSKKIAEKLAHAQKTNVAVVDLVNLEGGTTLLGRFLAEEIANDLGNSEKNFEIVDRTHLRTMMKEHKLSAGGFIDKLTATTVGNMTGAQALILGTITPFGDSLRITVKVLDTKTSHQIASESAEFAKIKALEEMYDKPLPEDEVKPAEKKDAKGSKIVKAAKQPEAEEEEGAAEPENVIETQGLTFHLTGCNKGGQSVTCNLTVTSASRDLDFYINGGTRIFDQKSAEYKVGEGKIANGGNYRDGSCILGKTIVRGVETPVKLVFEDIAPGSKKLSSLEVWFDFGRYCWDSKKISFRDIALAAGSHQPVASGGKHGGVAGAEEEGKKTLLDDAVDTVKDGVRNLLKGGFKKLQKKAKVPDPDEEPAPEKPKKNTT
jgi:TolB-like protein